MNQTPAFEAEIIIDEKGIITVRNCSAEMLELMFQLNPMNKEVQRRIELIRNQNNKRRNLV